jgi:hypothetical protein
MVLCLVQNGASSSSPDIHCDNNPEILTIPPVGRTGLTEIGGHPLGESNFTPRSANAFSNGLIGLR